MTQGQYQARQLVNLLEALESKQANGVLYLDAQINLEEKKRSCVLVWRDGRIIYGGPSIPDAQSFVKILEKKLNREWFDSTAAFAIRQVISQTSIRALLEQLVEMQLFTWMQIETVVQTQAVLILEQVLPHPGLFRFDSGTQIDICRSVELHKLMQDITYRQEQWVDIGRMIPSIEAVPHLQANALKSITDPFICQHLQEWVDGQRSLADIAEALDKDPLNVAQSYMHWVQVGWVIMSSGTPNADVTSPTVVDKTLE